MNVCMIKTVHLEVFNFVQYHLGFRCSMTYDRQISYDKTAEVQNPKFRIKSKWLFLEVKDVQQINFAIVFEQKNH